MKLRILKPQKHLGAIIGPCIIQPPVEYYKYEVERGLQVFVLMQVGESIPYIRYYDFVALLAFCHQNLIKIVDVIGIDPELLKPHIAERL
jgi:hypothetical protein